MDVIETAKNIGDYTIYSYTSFAYEFAEFLIKNKIAIKEPQSVILTSEITNERQVSIIQQSLKCPVYVEYGLVEYGPIAIKKEHEDYIVDEDNFYLEILDEGIYVTDLGFKYFPLFRYETGDKANLSNNSKIADIVGRTSNLFYLRFSCDNYIQVHSEVISHVLKFFPSCVAFQCVVNRNSILEHLIVKLDESHIKTSLVEDYILNKLQDYTKQKLSPQFSISFNTEFIRNSSGKSPSVFF